MDMIEFSNQIPAEHLAHIFKDFFEQHIVAYDVLKCIKFININEVTFNKSSIMYSVKLLQDEDKNKLLKNLSNLTLTIYGRTYKPSIFLNGDLLCITINK